MKKIILIAMYPLLLISCNKNISASGSTVIIAANQEVDTLTVVDNGITFINSGVNGFNVECEINKTTTASFFTLRAFSTTAFPINLSIQNLPGPLNSIGVYKIAPIDTSGLGFSGQFSDGLQGGESYSMDSVMVNITTAAVNTVIGNYTLWVRNDTVHKTVSGFIKCFQASIE